MKDSSFYRHAVFVLKVFLQLLNHKRDDGSSEVVVEGPQLWQKEDENVLPVMKLIPLLYSVD